MSIDLYNGDCLEIMKELPDKSVDLFVCDLPYGCLSTGFKNNGGEVERFIDGKSTNEKIKTAGGCAWDIKINLEKLWEQIKRLAKDDHTPVLMFCTTKFGYELIKSNESWFRYDLVWDKERGVSFLSANRMPLRGHEMIYVFSKAGAYYNRIDQKGNYKKWFRAGTANRKGSVYGDDIKIVNEEGGDGVRCVRSVIRVRNDAIRGNHPTEKPIELYKWLIQRYCPANGTILDPTAGSFNSCIAAWDLGINSIGIEKDKGFYDKAVEKTRAT